MAVSELFSSDDVCTTSWRQITSGGSFEESIFTLLRTPGCAERIQKFATACELYQSEVSI